MQHRKHKRDEEADEVALDTARTAMNLVRVHANEWRAALHAAGLQSEEHRKQLQSYVKKIRENLEIVDKWLGGAIPPEPIVDAVPAESPATPTAQ